MRIRLNRILGGKIPFLLVILLLVGLVFAGCTTGTVPKGWSGGTIAGDTLFIGSMEGKLVAISTSDGSRLWEVPLEKSESTGGGFGCAPTSTVVAVYGTPAVAGDLVYVGGYNGIIAAYNSDRGELRWVYPRRGNLDGPVVGGLIVAQGKVYFGYAGGKVYALDAIDGYEEWEFPVGGKIWSTPAIGGDTLFIGSFDKKLYAIDITTGKEKWEEPFETEGAIVSTPVVYNNTVYFGSFDRYLYAVDATNGSLRWKFMAGNWFWANPVVYNNTLYAGCLDGKVYARDAESGDKLAEFDLGSPVCSSPVLAGNSVIVATQEGVIYALNTDDNQKRQIVNLEEKVYAPLAISQGIIYVHTAKGALYAVDEQSGTIRQFFINSK